MAQAAVTTSGCSKSLVFGCPPKTTAITDTGHMGLQKLHGTTTMPKKRSKKTPLSQVDKRANRTISKERVPAEHVIAACYNRDLTP